MRRELEALRRKLRAKRGLPDLPSAHRPALTKVELTDMMTVGPETAKEELSRKTSEKRGQKSLGVYDKGASTDGPRLVVSPRIDDAGLSKALRQLDLYTDVKDLESADIVVSKRVAVAFRTVDQFIEGISDGSVMATLAKLKHEYLHPILIVQGEPEGEGNQASNSAVYDALSALLSEYHMPVLPTGNADETASAIQSLFRQEIAKQSKEKKGVQTTLDVASRQMFLVQGLPNVSATLAQRLLERFGSVKGIADANVEELMKVDGIGRVIAEGIHTVLRRKFGDKEE
jgi:ERCC4-type nuclease